MGGCSDARDYVLQAIDNIIAALVAIGNEEPIENVVRHLGLALAKLFGALEKLPRGGDMRDS